MELSEALSFVRQRHQGILVTIRGNGRPQLSNVLYLFGEDGLARVSVTDSRAKTANLRRDPRASLYVLGDSFFSYVVVEGTAELSAVARSSDDEAVDELAAVYRGLQGEHPDWADFRLAMVEQERLVVRIRPERAYGVIAS
jgi:PPOX class probable F420-dependent enzyme